MTKVGIISLGCPRNLVDSEVMLGFLNKEGFDTSGDIESCDVALVNTCAFIRDAVDESIEVILGLIELKKKGRIAHIIAAGCLVQRYREKLRDELDEIDGFVGTGDLAHIGSVIKGVLGKKRGFAVSKKPDFLYDHNHARVFLSPAHFAYIKIQEGCANRCSYCIIPELRGELRSRPMESILKEAEGFSGISELNIIGQDTTFYGHDLYGKARIAELLRSLAQKKAAPWIRLLYTHPAHYSDELLAVISEEGAVCRYLDLPVQHISDSVLKRMNRNTTGRKMRALIEDLRRRIPGVAIRTTVIVGFPGETESDFRELVDFIKETRFERLGAFTYSNEEGSRSSAFEDQVPEDVKNARLDEVMKLQQDISRTINESFLGRTLKVLVDGPADGSGGTFMARTEFDAPSVDGEVFVNGEGLKPGDFVSVKITDTLEYDLVAEISN